jgi:hypothetical protein
LTKGWPKSLTYLPSFGKSGKVNRRFPLAKPAHSSPAAMVHPSLPPPPATATMPEDRLHNVSGHQAETVVRMEGRKSMGTRVTLLTSNRRIRIVAECPEGIRPTSFTVGHASRISASTSRPRPLDVADLTDQTAGRAGIEAVAPM